MHFETKCCVLLVEAPHHSPKTTNCATYDTTSHHTGHRHKLAMAVCLDSQTFFTSFFIVPFDFYICISKYVYYHVSNHLQSVRVHIMWETCLVIWTRVKSWSVPFAKLQPCHQISGCLVHAFPTKENTDAHTTSTTTAQTRAGRRISIAIWVATGWVRPLSVGAVAEP